MNAFIIIVTIVIIFILLSVMGTIYKLKKKIDDLNEYHVYLAKKEAKEAYEKLTEKQKTQN